MTNARALALSVFDEVVARTGGEALVRAAEPAGTGAAATHILSIGKVALPMLAGVRRWAGLGAAPAVVVAPAAARGAAPGPGTEIHVADHPLPTARSVAAAAAARSFVAALDGRAGHRLLVLLSGGASSLLCAPAPPLTLDDKGAAIAAVATGGARIAQLNAVRKHLSAIKGGRLALVARVPVTVLALSDVVDSDPGTIGSGPFSPDPTTYADALGAIAAAGAQVPAAARALLEAGARGQRDETPRPGDRRLAHVRFEVLAGPERVFAEAQRTAAARGLATGTLWRDTEADVQALAQAVLDRAQQDGAGAPHVLIGNGEPSVRLPPAGGVGRGGRATHLALLVARGLARLPEAARARVVFLAAGTDDRDGNAPASGAVVDAGTWARAAARGVDPEAALRGFDSFRALDAAGDAIAGPGLTNLLDLHLLVMGD